MQQSSEIEHENTICKNEPICETEVKKKRGRRKKIIENTDFHLSNESQPLFSNLILPEFDKPVSENGIKKKTKGAKIIDTLTPVIPVSSSKTNHVILHLTCTIRDIDEYIQNNKWKYDSLNYNPDIPKDIIAYDQTPLQMSFANFSSEQSIPVSSENTKPLETPEIHTYSQICATCRGSGSVENTESSSNTTNKLNDSDNMQITDNEKIKKLKIQFYKNELQDKKSDCFWCTYPYDNDTCYILQYGYNGDIYGHGSFCSPECGVAFLKERMNWDDSTKLESYQLMNYYYGKPNHFNQSIKIAESPYYFLEKYFGNMTIQEFRRLNKSQHMMLIVDKPVTRVLPEIHEDNEYMLIGTGNTVNYGKYKVKRQSEKPTGPSRNSILREQFGLSSNQ
jgi:hypothetical protein